MFEPVGIKSVGRLYRKGVNALYILFCPKSPCIRFLRLVLYLYYYLYKVRYKLILSVLDTACELIDWFEMKIKRIFAADNFEIIKQVLY